MPWGGHRSGGIVTASNSSVAVVASLITDDTSLLQAALDASEHHVLITDRKGRIVFANLSLAERHGRVREELIGETVEQIMRTDNHGPAQLEKMRKAGMADLLIPRADAKPGLISEGRRGMILDDQ